MLRGSPKPIRLANRCFRIGRSPKQSQWTIMRRCTTRKGCHRSRRAPVPNMCSQLSSFSSVWCEAPAPGESDAGGVTRWSSRTTACTLHSFRRRLCSGERQREVAMTAVSTNRLPAQQHYGENAGDTPTHVLFVELKAGDGATDDNGGLGPAEAPGRPWVRARRGEQEAAGGTEHHPATGPARRS